MSLKAVHLFFVVVLSALCFGLCAWKLRDFIAFKATTDLLYSAGSFLMGLVVLWYGRRVYLKLKALSYL